MKVLLLILIVPTLACAQWEPEILWERNGDVPEAHFGALVFPLGDQNDDGFADWGVMSMGTWVGNELVGCRMQLFHGDTTPSQTPYMQLVADTTFNRFWGSSCGDLNGDGYTDWQLTLRYNALPDSELVKVYYGGPDADTTADLVFWIPFGYGSNGVFPYGYNDGNRFDFNGDGYDDLGIVQQTYPGFAHSFSVLYGGSSMDTIPDWIAHGYSGPPYDPSVIPDSFGDVSGDHISDFCSTSRDTINIYLGGSQPDTLPDIVLRDIVCYSPTLTADLNADGHADLVNPVSPGGQIFQGGEEMSAIPTWQLNFGCGSGPHNASSVGDINGDGFDDLTIADPSCGRLALYLGHFWVNPNPVWVVNDFQGPYDLLGATWGIPLGDVNNDGTDDWAIGTHSDEAGGVPGRVIILAGDPNLVVSTGDPRPEVPQNLEVSVYPNPFNSSTTIELSPPVTSSPLELILYNTLGQVAYHETLHPLTTTVRHTLSAEGLASGVYILAAQAGEIQKRVKVVVLK